MLPGMSESIASPENAKIPLAVYDFDGTLYRGDAFVDFLMRLIWRRPYRVLLIPWFVLLVKLWTIGVVKTETLKNRALAMADPNTIDRDVDGFWELRHTKIMPWAKQRISDELAEGRQVVIVTASPEVVIRGALPYLGLQEDQLIGTRTKIGTAGVAWHGRGKLKVDGRNCRGSEKVRRLEEWCTQRESEYEVESMTSDSTADMPLYRIARRRYYVQRGEIRPGTPGNKKLDEERG